MPTEPETTTKPPITQVRLDNATHHALKVLAAKCNVNSMGKMVQRLIEHWEQEERNIPAVKDYEELMES